MLQNGLACMFGGCQRFLGSARFVRGLAWCGGVVLMLRVIPMGELFRACYKMGWLVCLGVVRDSWGVLGSFVALHGVGSCSVQRVAHGVVCSFSVCCCCVICYCVCIVWFGGAV